MADKRPSPEAIEILRHAQCMAACDVEKAPCASCVDLGLRIDALARAFGAKCIRASLSEYEIHARGVPERLIELTIEAVERGR